MKPTSKSRYKRQLRSEMIINNQIIAELEIENEILLAAMEMNNIHNSEIKDWDKTKMNELSGTIKVFEDLPHRNKKIRQITFTKNCELRRAIKDFTRKLQYIPNCFFQVSFNNDFENQ